MTSYTIAIVSVVDIAGNLLVVRRIQDDADQNQGKWECPAGHIESGENPAVAALRETREETGFSVLIYPAAITVHLKNGDKAVQYLGVLIGDEIKPKPTLQPHEHDRYRWIKPNDLYNLKPTHKNMAENFARLCRVALRNRLKSSRATILGKTTMKRRKRSAGIETNYAPYTMVRRMPGPGEELKDAILVGDEVEVFLKSQVARQDLEEPEVKGVVEQRNRNMLWLRELGEDQEPARALNWDDRGSWAILRVYRGKDGVVQYINGNPYDPDKKVESQARGLALILDPEPPTRYEAVWGIMRGDTPDLDRTMAQAPQPIGIVAPHSSPNNTSGILTQVQEVLRDYGMEPDHVDMLGQNRVLILTQDADLKKSIMRVLKDKGKEVKATRRGGLVVRHRCAQGTTTIPIATDDDLVEADRVRQRRQRRVYQQEKVGAAGPSGIMPPGVAPAQQAIIVPAQQDLIKQYQKKYGDMTVTPSPGGAKQLTFRNPQQVQKYTRDMNNRTPTQGQQVAAARQGAARQHRVERVRRLARGLRVALQRDNVVAGREYLAGLLSMGVGVKTLVQSGLGTRDQWRTLGLYLRGVGEVAGARVARVMVRAVPGR